MWILKPAIRIILIILTIALYGVTALACYGGYFAPQYTAFPSVLTLGMPILVSITTIVTIAWFCFKHWFVGGLGVATLLLCLTPIRMWFPMNTPNKITSEGQVFTVLTWNILHGADLEKPDTDQARTLETILHADSDIVCLQEIFGFSPKNLAHYSQPLMDSLMMKYPYRLGDGTYDLRVLSKYPLRHIYFGSVNKFSLAEYFTVRLPGREIAMADVHLPSFHLDASEASIFQNTINPSTGQSTEQLGLQVINKLKSAFPVRAEAAKKVNRGFDGLSMPIIVCGDFNDVPASWTYRMFIKSGFRDAYAETSFFPTNTYYLHGLYFHLDQIFYRGDVVPIRVKRLDIKTSDHYPLLATFQLLPL